MAGCGPLAPLAVIRRAEECVLTSLVPNATYKFCKASLVLERSVQDIKFLDCHLIGPIEYSPFGVKGCLFCGCVFTDIDFGNVHILSSEFLGCHFIGCAPPRRCNGVEVIGSTNA